MQPMGNERPGAPNYGSRPPFPVGAPLQTTMPSQSPGPGPGPGPVHASDPSFSRPVAPPRFGGPPSMGPPTSSYPSYMGQNQRFPSPPYPSSAQTINPSGLPAAGQVIPPPVPPFGVNQAVSYPPMQQVLTPPPPPALRPQVQTPVPMGPPALEANLQPREPVPSSFELAFPVSRPVSQPPMQQYPFCAPQAGYVPPPPVVNSLVQSPKGSIQRGFQALVEEFSSLSVAPTPGSIDSGIDAKSLPRPFDGDVVPSSFSEMYPLNCHSRYLRLTTGAIPNSQSLLSRWHLPLGAVVHPLAEPPDGEEVSVINFGPTGIIRCRRCRTYINPYVTFTDGGRKWRCNICALFNDVPGDYFAHLDANGRRCDIDQRPELSKGSVEFVAPTEYMVRPPMPPLYFFLIDVSLTAVRSGMLEIAANTIKACLNNLPGFPRTQIGFITFDRVRFTTYHGHFMLRSSDLMALPAVDCDKAFAMQLALEETLLTTQTVYFQVALLYTSSSGERRIRVHTAAAPVVADLGEMYRLADTGAVVTLLSRMAVERTLTSKLEDARQTVQLKIVKSLKEYRNLYAVQHRLTGRLIYPDSLKYLPLYALALCKSIPLRGGYADAQLDERCAAGYNLMIVPISRLLKLLYPSLFRINEYLSKGPDTVDDYAKVLQRVPLTADSLDPRGLFLYDDGFRFIIWFGKVLSSDIIANIIGADLMGFVSLSEINLTEQNNQFSRKLFLMLKKMRESDPSFYQHCHLVRQGEQPMEGSLLLLNLVEDQIGGTSGLR